MSAVRLVAALLVLAAPGLACAQTAPADDFQRGVELRLAGRPADAVVALERAAQQNPEDADVWLNLGLAYSATGRFDRAEQAFDRTLALAPDYTDAQIARARLSYFRGDLKEARSRLDPVLTAHPANSDARDLAARIAAAGAGDAPWRLTAMYSHGFLSEGLPSANQALVSLSRQFRGGAVLAASVERAHQFDDTDVYGELVAANRRGSVAIGGAPNSVFRPRLRIGGQIGPWIGRAAAWTWRPTLDLAWADYRTGDVISFSPGVELARGDEFGLTARWINVLDEEDEIQSGYSLFGQWRPAAPLQLSLGWADAPDSDVGRTMRVKTVSGGVAVEVGPRTTLRLSVDHEMRKAYDRDNLTFVVTRKF